MTLCMMIKWESKTKKRAVQFIWFYAYFVFCSFLPWDLACNFLSLFLADCFDVFEGTDSTVTVFFCPYKRVKVSHRSVSYLKDKRQRQVTCALYLGRCELKSLWKVAFGVGTSILRNPEEKKSKKCHWMKEKTKTKVKTKMTWCDWVTQPAWLSQIIGHQVFVKNNLELLSTTESPKGQWFRASSYRFLEIPLGLKTSQIMISRI